MCIRDRSNESFYINPPSLFDKDYNQLQELETAHSLKQNDDGSYRYTKYFSINGYLRNSYDIKYIDADLAASTSEDGTYIYRQPNVLNSSFNRYTSTFLTGARNATTANNVIPVIEKSTTETSVVCGLLNTYSSSSSQFGGVVINTACSMYHSFFVFNSSGITDLSLIHISEPTRPY